MSFLRSCFQHLPLTARRRIPATPPSVARLHRLERPEPLPTPLRDLVRSSMPENLANFYPDYGAFKSRLAAFAGVAEKRLVMGQGIESLVRDLVMLTCDPGDVFAFTAPTCAMFPLYAEIFGARAHPINVGWHGIEAAALAWRLPDAAKLVLLPNPGQPVDVAFDAPDVAYLARVCEGQGAVLAIDEAYFGFGAETCVDLTEAFENLVVLRTFSKAFGGAGLRVGFAVGSGEVIAALDGCRQSGELSAYSMLVADVMMARFDDVVRPMVEEICAGRDWVRRRLSDDGFEVRGSRSNHVLVDLTTNEAAEAMAKALDARGFRVRTNPVPLDHCLMVTCGSTALMQRFHAAFSQAREDLGELARLH